jgi:tRNA threonylcarbamoyladenosine biosynthesis protein TsaB
MRVLALDTTTAAGSVAIVDDDRVLVEISGDAARSPAERLPDEVLRALAQSGIDIGAIDVYAIAAGPGTFTGLRIGIATIQGFAFATGKQVVPISALHALAVAATRQQPAARVVAAWMDAHRRDVFSALFEVTDRPPYDAGQLIELEGAAVGDPAATLQRWREQGRSPDVVVGDGAVAFRAAIPDQTATFGQLPLAATIARMALARARTGDAVDPAGVQPLYVRRPDAEIARDVRRLSALEAERLKPKA